MSNGKAVDFILYVLRSHGRKEPGEENEIFFLVFFQIEAA